MGKDAVSRFRRAAEQRQGLRYPRELKELGRTHGRTALAQGRSRRAAARELGVTEVTLGRWLAEDEAPPDLFGEVLVSDPRGGGVTLVSPVGWRVEGLSVAEIVGLLAALK